MRRWHYSTWFRIAFAIIAVVTAVWGTLLYDALIDYDSAAQYRAAHAAALAELPEVAEDAVVLPEGRRRLAAEPAVANPDGSVSDQIAADGALVTYFSGMANGLIAAVAVVWTGAVGSILLIIRPPGHRRSGRDARLRVDAPGPGPAPTTVSQDEGRGRLSP